MHVKLLSARTWNDYFPLQVVYEWEDIIADRCHYPLDFDSTGAMDQIFNKPFNRQLQRVVRNSFLRNHVDNSFNYLKRKGGYYLSFVLYPSPVQNHYVYSESCIPILLDCFADVIDKVPDYFRRNKLVFVTNLEVFEYLKNSSIGSRLRFIPMSISDIYIKDAAPEKSIDVLQVGRQNIVLHEWMMRTVSQYPHIDYVFSDEKKGGYHSTRRGWRGTVDTRADYMKLLGSAKISLLSSPGIDGGEKRTGGYNPVTPRFYESAISHCHLLGRFPDAPDFVANNVSDVCERTSTFEEFSARVLSMIETPVRMDAARKNFIQRHLTSTVAAEIKQELQKL